MKFFIPFAENEEQETKFYQSIKEFVGKSNGVAKLDKRKIFYIKLNADNLNIKIEVGKINNFNGEMVIAILYDPSRRIFHVCTPSRGVVRGKSIIVHESSVAEIEYFDVDNN